MLLKNLSNGKVKETKNLGGGINETIILKDGFKGVFKPSSGEVNCRKSIPFGTFYKREIAAYEIDRIFNIGLIPTTTLRTEIVFENGDKREEIGSIQNFVENAKTFYKSNIYPNDEDWQLMAFLDFILANEDRHGGNFMITKNKKIVAIDNGLTLGEGFVDSLNIQRQWYISDKPLSKKIVEILKNFDEKKLKELKITLLNSELLTEISYKSLLGRIYLFLKLTKKINDNYQFKGDVESAINNGTKFYLDLTIEEIENKIKKVMIKD
jgi:hypothetical protein